MVAAPQRMAPPRAQIGPCVASDTTGSVSRCGPRAHTPKHGNLDAYPSQAAIDALPA
jgi:hypothetical protein